MITKQELIEVLDIYILPFYVIIDSAVALFIIVSAVYFVLHNFIRRV